MHRKFRIFIILIAIVVSGYSFTGMINRSVELKRSLHINNPVSEVFSATIVPVEIREWLPAFQGFKPIHGSFDGPGNQFLVTILVGKRTQSVLMDLTEFEAGKEVEVVLHLPHMDSRINIGYETVNNGTYLTVHAEITGKGLFRKSALTIFRPGLKRKMRSALRDLEDYLSKKQPET